MAIQAGPTRAPGLAAAIAALALFCAYIAVTGLAETFGDMTAGGRLIRVRAGAAAAVPTAAMLLLVAMLLFRQPSATGRRERRLFVAVLACLPLLGVMPIGLTWGMGNRLANQGYRECDGPMGGRGSLTRLWARADTPCPAI